MIWIFQHFCVEKFNIFLFEIIKCFNFYQEKDRFQGIGLFLSLVYAYEFEIWTCKEIDRFNGNYFPYSSHQVTSFCFSIYYNEYGFDKE
jgi:hypothetical protein